MNLLYTVLGFRLVFGTRIGNAMFAVFGLSVGFALMADGSVTGFGISLLALSAFAAKRALKPN